MHMDLSNLDSLEMVYGKGQLSLSVHVQSENVIFQEGSVVNHVLIGWILIGF